MCLLLLTDVLQHHVWSFLCLKDRFKTITISHLWKTSIENHTFDFLLHGCPITITFDNDCHCGTCGFFLTNDDNGTTPLEINSLHLYPKYNKLRTTVKYHCAEFEKYNLIQTELVNCAETSYKVWLHPQLKWIIGEDQPNKADAWFDLMQDCSPVLEPHSRFMFSAYGMFLDVSEVEKEDDGDDDDDDDNNDEKRIHVTLKPSDICPKPKDLISTLKGLKLLDLVYFFQYYRVLVPLRRIYPENEILHYVELVQNLCGKLQCANLWKDYIPVWMKKISCQLKSSTKITTLTFMETIEILEKMYERWIEIDNKMRLIVPSPFKTWQLMENIITNKSNRSEILKITSNF